MATKKPGEPSTQLRSAYKTKKKLDVIYFIAGNFARFRVLFFSVWRWDDETPSRTPVMKFDNKIRKSLIYSYLLNHVDKFVN